MHLVQKNRQTKAQPTTRLGLASLIRLCLLPVLFIVLTACADGVKNTNQPTSAWPSTDYVSEPSSGSELARVAIIGDSYTSGSNMGGLGAENWTSKIESMLSPNHPPLDITSKGLGGAGYAYRSAYDKNFMDAADEVLSPDTDVVIVFGSRNDLRTVGQVGKAATTLYEHIESLSPHAQLIVVGFPIPYDVPTKADNLVATEIADAAAGEAEFFIDPIADNWFDDESLIGSDEVHPTDEGHDVIARRIAPVLHEALVASRVQ